jgi:hypothetical protein
MDIEDIIKDEDTVQCLLGKLSATDTCPDIPIIMVKHENQEVSDFFDEDMRNRGFKLDVQGTELNLRFNYVTLIGSNGQENILSGLCFSAPLSEMEPWHNSWMDIGTLLFLHINPAGNDMKAFLHQWDDPDGYSQCVENDIAEANRKMWIEVFDAH